MSAVVDQRVAQFLELQRRQQQSLLRTGDDPKNRRRVPDEAEVGSIRLLRRERYALRRYTRQLKSPVRPDGTRDIVYLDPLLAQSMMQKKLVVSIEGRQPEHMLFMANGAVIYLNRLDAQPEYQVPTVLTQFGRSLLEALLRMEGD